MTAQKHQLDTEKMACTCGYPRLGHWARNKDKQRRAIRDHIENMRSLQRLQQLNKDAGR